MFVSRYRGTSGTTLTNGGLLPSSAVRNLQQRAIFLHSEQTQVLHELPGDSALAHSCMLAGVRQSASACANIHTGKLLPRHARALIYMSVLQQPGVRIYSDEYSSSCFQKLVFTNTSNVCFDEGYCFKLQCCL